MMQSTGTIKRCSYHTDNQINNHAFGILCSDTVKSKMLARVLFSRNFADMRSFVKIKPQRKGEITLSLTDVGKPCTSRVFFSTSQICLPTLFVQKKSRKIFLIYVRKW